jgi:hypothetical protein
MFEWPDYSLVKYLENVGAVWGEKYIFKFFG